VVFRRQYERDDDRREAKRHDDEERSTPRSSVSLLALEKTNIDEPRVNVRIALF